MSGSDGAAGPRLAPFGLAEATSVPPSGRACAAMVMAFDDAGRALCQLRDDHAPVAGAGLWHFFGGAVEPGESWRAAAAREFAEETGLAVPEDAFQPHLRILNPVDTGRDLDLVCFRLTRAVAPAEIRLGEGAGFGFLTAAQIARFAFVSSSKLILRLEYGGDQSGR